MEYEQNTFLEYLELQNGKAKLVTKSQLLSQVRRNGFKISERQLTYYLTENLIPHSVRAGSRAGVYPAIVVNLLVWILYMRKVGASIEAIRELLPVWKLLVKSRNNRSLDIAELEYVARQNLSLPDALSAVPIVVSHVMVKRCCADCRHKVVVIDRNGDTVDTNSATIGFAIAGPIATEEDDDPTTTDRWVATTRISLALPLSPNTDPMTVRLGRKPNEPLPPDEPPAVHRRLPDEEQEDILSA